MNVELRRLFEADQAVRQGAVDIAEMRRSDATRRARVRAILDSGGAVEAADFYHAAMVFQHGETVDEIWTAHEMAQRAADMGEPRAKWLCAASLDRWLMYQQKPQRYGTQFVSVDGRWRLWDVDLVTTDAERAEFDVPALATQRAKADRLTREAPPPSQ